MADQHGIANLALGFVGASAIQSFSDGSAEASAVQASYELAVRECLEDHPWNFAEACIKLVADTAAVRPDFAYSYNIPVDFVSARHLLTDDGRGTSAHYTLAKGKICTDLEKPWLVYTYRAPEQFFSSKFTWALAYLLAHHLALLLSEDSNKAKLLRELYERQITIARSRDSQQDTPDAISFDLLLAHHGG